MAVVFRLVDPVPLTTIVTPRCRPHPLPTFRRAMCGLEPSAWNASRFATPICCAFIKTYQGFSQQFAAEVDRILVNGSLSPAEIQTFVRQVMQTIGRSVNRELTALAFSQKTVQLLFKTQSQSGRELYVLLLSKLCDSWPKVNKEAIDWLLYSDDEVSATSVLCILASEPGIAQVQCACNHRFGQVQANQRPRLRPSTVQNGCA